MLSLLLKPCKRINILCLGAHCDDIEIGCGGTVLTLLSGEADICVHWIVFSGSRERAMEARQSANKFLAKAKSKKISILQHRDGFLPYVGSRIKMEFEKLKLGFDPDLIFTHFREDFHQDHRIISELTWNTWRNHLILEYEIPKYDGDLGRPNLYVSIDENIFSRKVYDILNIFRSQSGKQWFESPTFYGLARLRGMECNSASKLAEAFYCRKIILDAI